MYEIPAEYAARMKNTPGIDFTSFTEAYGDGAVPKHAVRVNTLKITPEEFERISAVPLLGRVPWDGDGFYCPEGKYGKSVEYCAGLIYPQEPSAMSAVPCLGVRPGDRVLDLCAAPGGKATQIAQRLKGSGLIVANDPDPARARTVASNFTRLGVTDGMVLSESPERLADVFPSYFDRILVDAPCSGEGMFRKDPGAAAEWSPEKVRGCAKRQMRILSEAYKMLAGGGTLVYSTCTFSVEEDEGVAEKFASSHPDISLKSMKKLMPWDIEGEGHFTAVFEKTDGERCDLPGARTGLTGRERDALRFLPDGAACPRPDRTVCRGGVYLTLPEGLPETPLTPLLEGYAVCLAEKGRLTPMHALATVSDVIRTGCAEIEVSRETALAYLSGMTFPCGPDERGWKTVSYMGHPLGWCRCTDGTAKNRLPKKYRI